MLVVVVRHRFLLTFRAQQLVPLVMPITGSTTTGDVISLVFHGFLYRGESRILSPIRFRLLIRASISALNGHMATALQADNVLAAAGFLFGNSGRLSAYYIPSSGALTVTSSTSGAATETLTPVRLPAGTIVSGHDYTFLYNTILQGWIVIFNGGGCQQASRLKSSMKFVHAPMSAHGLRFQLLIHKHRLSLLGPQPLLIYRTSCHRQNMPTKSGIRSKRQPIW